MWCPTVFCIIYVEGKVSVALLWQEALDKNNSTKNMRLDIDAFSDLMSYGVLSA